MDVWLLNRGNRKVIPAGVHQIIGDIHDEAGISRKIADMSFDCVREFVGFVKEDERRRRGEAL